MVKEVILALRAAGDDHATVAVVLSGTGTRAFCTADTREYAEATRAIPANIGDTCDC